MKLHCVLATALICISVVFECRASEEGDANPEVVPQDSDGGMKSAPESKLNVEASVFHSKEEMEAARPQSASAIKWAEVDDTGCGAHLSFFANFDLNVECKSVCDGLFEAAKKLCPDVNLVLGSTSDTGTNKGAQDGESMHSAGAYDSDTDSLHSAPVTSDSDHADGKDLDSVQQPAMAGAKEEDGSSLASQPEKACKGDADCLGDDVCIGHKCSHESCQEKTECAQGLTCFNNKCKVAIGSDVACLSDADCEGYKEGQRSIVCGIAHWSSKHVQERQQERERCCERVDHAEESTNGEVIDDPTCCSRKRRGKKCCVQPGGLHDENFPKVCCSAEFEELQDEEQEAAKTAGHGQKVCKSMQSANADGKPDGEDPNSVPPTPKDD